MLNRLLIVSFAFLCMSACASSNHTAAERTLPTVKVVEGTKTAVVGIGVDKRGYPVETVKEIVLSPGQRVLLAGPDEFQIYFKKGKSPSKDIRFSSSNGVVFIDIPKDIFRNPAYQEEYKKNQFLTFNYAIKIKDRELDPILIVKKDD